MNKSCDHSFQNPIAPAMARRWFLTASGFSALLFGTYFQAPAFARKQNIEPIKQPPIPDEMAFISRAFVMRRLAVEYGDQAYGAVIVRNRIIVGQSWSRVILDQDPTGHAEMAAIRDAASRLNSRELGGAVIYSSSRPCPMCEAAAYWAGIGQMIHGRNATSAGSPQLCR